MNEFGIALVEGRKVKPSVARERMPRARAALWELRERGKMNESLKLRLAAGADESISQDDTGENSQTFINIFLIKEIFSVLAQKPLSLGKWLFLLLILIMGF